MKKALLFLLPLLLLIGCQSTLDKQAVAANADNVHAITDINERYLAADTVRAPSLIKLERDQNKAAIQLADQMEASAK